MEDKKKVRVLQLVTRSDWAGAQKVLYTLVYGLLKYYPGKFEIEVACGQENGMLITELKKLGIEVHIIPDLVREISPIKDLKSYLQLKRLLREKKYDVVHSHSSKVRLLGGIAAMRSNVKSLIYTVHGWWHIEQYKGIKRRIFIIAERIAAHFCDRIVLLCKRDLDKAKQWKIGRESQYVIIQNAIVPTEKVQKGKLKKELGLDENVEIVGNVARLDPPKNPIRFLEVAKLVFKQRTDVAFVWIGGSIVDDSYGKLVQKWLDENPDVAKHVYLLPFRKDAIELMADFDVFLLTSDAEGMPLVVLEALSQGIPVVSTDVGCVGEMEKQVSIADSIESLCKNVLEILSDTFQSVCAAPGCNFEDFIVNYAKLFCGA
ncbi:glycosyltransferase [Pseudothermotoga lettingae]|uniref:Glycosyl transferase group 1 n=1 Tax=Pseudothermotoga lettingae (strain ATCC BAA-301 / DSM 14385 / NBRC 107922 / TMO) TaxID=416591 RepID=A8F6F4_PSELT|nr:glycosyltransferase [Pseudothermotoga lettingae]ABV33738.1 glycosyl transferase group 1 [Pseudothermotoga lettingae TMO]GLI49344.1 glycosyltransferase family 1 [Pseudothermotoga lettingae TMO]